MHKCGNIYPATFEFWQPHLAVWAQRLTGWLGPRPNQPILAGWLGRSSSQPIDWKTAKYLLESLLGLLSLLRASQMTETRPNGLDSAKLLGLSQMAANQSNGCKSVKWLRLSKCLQLSQMAGSQPKHKASGGKHYIAMDDLFIGRIFSYKETQC